MIAKRLVRIVVTMFILSRRFNFCSMIVRPYFIPLYRIKTLTRCGAPKDFVLERGCLENTPTLPQLPAAALVRAAVRQDARSGRAAPAHIRARADATRLLPLARASGPRGGHHGAFFEK